jgi:hypothetical protein
VTKAPQRRTHQQFSTTAPVCDPKSTSFCGISTSLDTLRPGPAINLDKRIVLPVYSVAVAGRSMANILFLLFCGNILILVASQFQNRGHRWADLICTNAFGLCDQQSQWLAIGALVLFIATYLANKNRRA